MDGPKIWKSEEKAAVRRMKENEALGPDGNAIGN